MTDKEIKDLFKVPHSTLWTWKKGKSSSYKKNIYNFFRSLTREEAIQIFNRFNPKENQLKNKE